jgi:hypothetical protein
LKSNCQPQICINIICLPASFTGEGSLYLCDALKSLDDQRELNERDNQENDRPTTKLPLTTNSPKA